MKTSEGTGAAVELLVPVSVPRPWKTSPLTEGQTLGRKHWGRSQEDWKF